MVQTHVDYASPLRAAQAEIARLLIVCGAALALILAGPALPL